MSEIIKHECGIALVRLRKPLSFYREKYGSARYGLHKLYLLMEKMINRGQDGAGVAVVKLDTPPGIKYIDRQRSVETKATQDIFLRINENFTEAQKKFPDQYQDVNWQKENIPFLGELLLGHLRYGTYGKNNIESCHPFLRQNNWKTRNLVVAGNFNLTNVDELFDHLVEIGQHPREKSDTVTVMEKIGHFLDVENERIFKIHKQLGKSNQEISECIAEDLDIASVLKIAGKKWDGGYVMAGLLGHGDAFVLRDPNGIRPAFYFQNEEFVVVASERPVIQTVFDVKFDEVKELDRGSAIIIKKNGDFNIRQVRTQRENKQCSFERIYFSRGNDAEIYKERKNLGKNLVLPVLKSVNNDLKNTVFTYIPNTAEVAFGGLIDSLHAFLNEEKKNLLFNRQNDYDEKQLIDLLSIQPRVEKIVLKDAKQRTFITDDVSRDDLVSLVYDITYGKVRENIDNLVLLDDSIVRGTTLKKSILRIIDRLKPKKIVVVSSAPQIRYPDCYGIDMAVLGKFIAFEAAISLLRQRGLGNILEDVYSKAKYQLTLPKEDQVNVVKEIYAPFSADEISVKIAELIKPSDLSSEFEIIYQSIEGLHASCPAHLGDWYFTGNYPTAGGIRVANKAFVHYMEGKLVRAY
jgi:amidophosphoribosyltransferase